MNLKTNPTANKVYPNEKNILRLKFDYKIKHLLTYNENDKFISKR